MIEKTSKQEEWESMCCKFLHAISGRYGIPLPYLIRSNIVPLAIPDLEFLDDYINDCVNIAYVKL